MQEPRLLEEGCSVTNCLLEGAVVVGPGNVIQHCSLEVGGLCSPLEPSVVQVFLDYHAANSSL